MNLYRAIVKADNRLPENLSQKILPNARWLTAAPIAAALVAVLRHYGPFWRQSGAQSRTFGGVFIAGGIVPRFLEFFKPLVSAPHLKIKGALRNMSMNSGISHRP